MHQTITSRFHLARKGSTAQVLRNASPGMGPRFSNWREMSCRFENQLANNETWGSARIRSCA